MGWELEELEEAALLAVAEQQNGGGSPDSDGAEDSLHTLTHQVQNMEHTHRVTHTQSHTHLL